MDVAAVKLHELVELLHSLFAPAELRQWLHGLPDGELLSRDLPTEPATPNLLVSEAVQALVRHGMLSEHVFWDSLILARPRREVDILAVRGGAAYRRERAVASPETPSAKMNKAVRICLRCGVAAAAAARPCRGVAPQHEFAEFVGVVFCRDCGVVPADDTPSCTGARAMHRFTRADVAPTCRRCGRTAGVRSQCGGLSPAHAFPEE